MAVNGYFQLEQDGKSVRLHVFSPIDGGKYVTTEEIMQYLDLISFAEYEVVDLDSYIQARDYDLPLLLADTEMLPERERCVVSFSEKGERAYARFYPPSTGGQMLTMEDIISDLQFAGVKHGIRKKAIQHFLDDRQYCRRYILAEATLPIEGHDASIQYFFDVNATAKPKQNEDGSVDFHQLGNIELAEKGMKLAELTPADRGRAGISVLGTPLPPRKVKVLRLRYGRNIRMTEDKCRLFAEVPGHVTLVDDMVMLSDVYRVPANVDASTGDITFSGTVEVTGNVNTGFAVDATGDIIVNGVVEGAILKSGGNIVLKRGMQGMERGKLEAAGNITAKFLENCKVKCDGGLMADAVLHSEVECKEKIEIKGKKGLINGGHIRTYGEISASTIGSTMGSSTKVEVMSERDLILRRNELLDSIKEKEEELKKIESVAEVVKQQLAQKAEVAEEHLAFIKRAAKMKPQIKKDIKQMQYEADSIQATIDKNRGACIKVYKEVFSGVKLMVKDAMRIQNEHLSHCRFIRDGADVKMEGL